MRFIRHIYDCRMLWKRWSLWLQKCEVCGRRSLMQYEVGVGYWVCGKSSCSAEANRRVLVDLEEWQLARISRMADSCESNIDY